MIVQGKEICYWVCEKTKGTVGQNDVGIAQLYNDKIVFGMNYYGYNEASIWLGVRCDNPTHITKSLYKAMFDYPFRQLKVKRVNALISSANTKSLSLTRKVGFKEEAILKDYFPDGDGILFVMRPEYCRMLNWSK